VARWASLVDPQPLGNERDFANGRFDFSQGRAEFGDDRPLLRILQFEARNLLARKGIEEIKVLGTENHRLLNSQRTALLALVSELRTRIASENPSDSNAQIAVASTAGSADCG
jgi:hypothetical protein